MNADGSNLTQITTTTAIDSEPAWSPDGQRIAFVSTRPGRHCIYVMDTDGSNLTQITKIKFQDHEDRDPAWSPDGKRIAFAAHSHGHDREAGIYVVDANGTNRTQIAKGGEEPAWSPDGKRIAFASHLKDYLSHLTDWYRAWSIYVVDANGTNRTQITKGGEAPAWSPDGRRIAFASFGQDRAHDIYVMDANGTNRTRLTYHSATDRLPAWSPDGKRIAFNSNRDRNWEIYVITLD